MGEVGRCLSSKVVVFFDLPSGVLILEILLLLGGLESRITRVTPGLLRVCVLIESFP